MEGPYVVTGAAVVLGALALSAALLLATGGDGKHPTDPRQERRELLSERAERSAQRRTAEPRGALRRRDDLVERRSHVERK